MIVKIFDLVSQRSLLFILRATLEVLIKICLLKLFRSDEISVISLTRLCSVTHLCCSGEGNKRWNFALSSLKGDVTVSFQTLKTHTMQILRQQILISS